jgi:hypothetical protein
MTKNLLLLLLFFCSNQLNAQICFSPKVNYRTGVNPAAICHADFNNDTIEDLAIANKMGSISVLLGNGNGTFGLNQEYSTGLIPNSICSGDFNSDGQTDLATSNSGPFNVTAVYGNGTGSFGIDSAIGQINHPLELITEDFNRDGFADIAVANPFKVTLFTGNGSGQFTSSTWGSGFGYYAITSGEVNGDTLPDLVLSTGTDEVAIMINAGMGNFNAPVFYPTGMWPYSIVCSDFNSDGWSDVATSNSYTNTVSVLLNNGNGTFGLPDSFPVGDNPKSLIAADFNNDNNIDLAVANTNSFDISILSGDGTGNFSTTLTMVADSFPYAITAADFNADGIADLAVVTAYTNLDSGYVDVYLNCSTTGIEELNNNIFSVYPNPGNGIFSLVANKFFKPENIAVYSLDGRKIIQSINNTVIDLSNQQSGLYILEVNFDGELLYKKLIKN